MLSSPHITLHKMKKNDQPEMRQCPVCNAVSHTVAKTAHTAYAIAHKEVAIEYIESATAHIETRAVHVRPFESTVIAL